MPIHVITKKSPDGSLQYLIRWKLKHEMKWRRWTTARVAEHFDLRDPGPTNRRKVERLAKAVGEALGRIDAPGRQRLSPQVVSVRDAVDAFVQAGHEEKAPRTAQDRPQRLRPLLEYFGPTAHLQRLTPKQIGEMRSWLLTRPARDSDGTERPGTKLTPMGANGYLRVIRSFLTFACKRGWLTWPIAAYRELTKLLTEPESAARWIPRKDARRLLEVALDDPTRCGRFVALGLLCPFRPGEILRLEWDDLVLDQTDDVDAHIVVRRSKTHQSRQVPVWHAPELVAWLLEQRKEAKGPHVIEPARGTGPLRSCQFWKGWLRKRLATKWRPKDLRSNACSRFASWKRGGAVVTSAHDLARAAGHDVKVAQTYYVELLRSHGSPTFEGEVGVSGLLGTPAAPGKPNVEALRKRLASLDPETLAQLLDSLTPGAGS